MDSPYHSLTIGDFLATIGDFSGLPTIVSVTRVSIMGGKLIL